MIPEIITQNWKMIFLGLLLLFLIIIVIVFREKFKKKIKEESISFIAMILSIGFATYGFIEQPKIESTTMATILGREVSLVIPLVWVFISMLVIALIVFFKKELAMRV